MKSKTRYSNEPLEMEVIPDFLPPPDKLVLKEENVKVTISLSKPSVEFFKRKARAQRTPYQKMIRRVLDLYAERYQ
jgi:predicted DNA binding CopG/RHH family protein